MLTAQNRVGLEATAGVMGARRFPRRARWIAAALGSSEAGRERSSSLDAEAQKKRLKIPLKNQEAGFLEALLSVFSRRREF